ncbi:hypothetical protein SAMN05216489_03707 [Streptomyces sp. 3213]|nr:hypothetical protein SAMN05216489_03707 [Streptomyces sp. 3213] [Streptomyces sp. 3213.3]
MRRRSFCGSVLDLKVDRYPRQDQRQCSRADRPGIHPDPRWQPRRPLQAHDPHPLLTACEQIVATDGPIEVGLTVEGAISLHHHSPQLPSRPPSTHTPWSGRGSWRPGGARHCTNDLDAMGRVCSALPGSMVVGMEAPRAYPYESAPGDGAPFIPVSADPPPEACSDLHHPVRSPRSASIDGASSRRAPAFGVKASVGLWRIMRVDLWAMPSSSGPGLVVWGMGGESGSVRCIGPLAGSECEA